MRTQQNSLSAPFILVMGCAFFISLSYSPALGAEFRNFEAPSEKLIDRLPSFRSRTLSSPPTNSKSSKKREKGDS